MDIIIFQNKEFKVREVQFPEVGNTLISTISLNESLMNEHGGYVSDEAITVDEKIFYFVNDDEMNLSDEDLINLITEELK